jgi:hypothetical protein
MAVEMLMRIPQNMAVTGLLAAFGLLVVFHVLVLVGIVPSDIVWQSRINSFGQLLVLELLSLTILAGMIAVVWGRKTRNTRPLRVAMWIISAFFALNTLANAFASNAFERIVFTPVTLVLMVLALRLTRAEPTPVTPAVDTI